jgi:kumamolisin
VADPASKSGVAGIPQTRRATPDIASDADPSTGVWVYANPYWYIVGGTSVSAPVWAGIVNSASSAIGRFADSSQSELTILYANRTSASGFTDITAGSCGPNQGYKFLTGWDFCTGIGTPLTLSGKSP